MDKLTHALNTEHLFTEDDVMKWFVSEDKLINVYDNPDFNCEGSEGDTILVDYYAASKAIEYAIEQLTDILWYFEHGNSNLAQGVVERLKSKLMRHEYEWGD